MGENQGREAARSCELLNRNHPDFASGWHTASRLALRLGNVKGALAAIEKALSLDAHPVAWKLQQATCLARLRRFDDVAELVSQIPEDGLSTAYHFTSFGTLQMQLSNNEAALAYFQKAAELEPGDARHHYNVACMQRALGELTEAEASYDRAIELNTADYESIKIRSELRKQTRERNHVAELEQLMQQGIDEDRGWVQVCYALAKELEDLGESERSFDWLKMGSDRRRSLMKYDVDRDLATVEAIRQVFSPAVFANAPAGSDNAESIFVLGMPRTGTTLVERILASHSKVHSAGELNNFAMQLTAKMHALSSDRKLTRDELVAESAKLDFAELGEAYVQSTRPFTGHTARFIDKMPLNYLYVGLLHLALPNATIINLQRHPMDTCYAVYKQLFVDAYPFSYKLEELAQYYVAYHQLMEHWNEVLPGVVHTVQYEKLVADQEGESRRLVEACGLDWEPQCLRFYESKEASTTASTAQVRQPVYRSSVAKWRNYEKQLQPVVEILGQAGINIEDQP